MNQKNGFLPVILGVITACSILIIAVILCLDIIMRGFFPGIYLGSRIAGTYNELKKENSLIDSFFTYKGLNLSNNLSVAVNGNFSNIGFDFNGQCNVSDSKIYLDGSTALSNKTVDTQFFYDNGSYGICLPEYADAWICSNTDTSDNSTSGYSSQNVPDPVVSSLLQELMHNAKIKKYSEIDNNIFEYTVYTDGDIWEKIFSEVSDRLLDDTDNIDNSSEDSMTYIITDCLSDIDLPKTVMFTIRERDKKIVYARCLTTLNNENIDVWFDMSGSEHLLDSVDIGMLYSVDGNQTSLSVKSSGNNFNLSKNLYNKAQIEINVPLLDKIIIDTECNFTDMSNFNYSLNMEIENLCVAQVSGTGVYTDDGLSVIADNILFDLGFISYSGYSAITMKETDQTFNIPQKTQYTVDSPLSDLYNLIYSNISQN